MRHNRFLVNETNRCTESQFYWYYDSTCFGQPFRPSSGVLGRTTAVVHFMQLWLFATRNYHFHPTPGSKRSEVHKMYHSRFTAKNSWWWAERLPETCTVIIPIKLEFSASIGFIHKESVWMVSQLKSETSTSKMYVTTNFLSTKHHEDFHEVKIFHSIVMPLYLLRYPLSSFGHRNVPSYTVISKV